MARQFTWFPADGSASIVLNDRSAGYRLMQAGTTGLHSPTYRLTTDHYAGVDGTTLLSLSADQRPVTLSMVIEAPDEATFRVRWRALVRAMRPATGDGTLQSKAEDGSIRQLTCRYLSGLEGDGADMFDGTQGRANLELVAFDPWWRGSDVPIEFGLAAPSVFLSDTQPWRMLSSSAIQGQQTVDLSSTDAPAFPLWTITGPGASLELRNLTTGRVITVNAPLGDGQTMVIDTRRGQQAVYRSDLAVGDPNRNLMGFLASDPALWRLVEGVNVVSATLGNAGEASRIRGVYAPRYAGI